MRPSHRTGACRRRRVDSLPALATPPVGVHVTYLAPIAQFDEIDA